MNSIQAKSYLDILKKGLTNIVAVNHNRDWQQQRFYIFTETCNALDAVSQFHYRLIKEEGLLFIDNREIENLMPELEAKEFRTLIRAYSTIISTTRYPNEFQFVTKRTKVLQMLNHPQIPVLTPNNLMARNVRKENIYNLSQISDSIYIEFIRNASEFKMQNSTRVYAIMLDRGRKADYIQMPDYEVNQVNILVQSWKLNKKWVDSIYLNWLMYEIENDINKIPTFFSFLFDLLEDSSFIVVLSKNDFECYGCCMSLYTIIDKIYVLHDNTFYYNEICDTRIKLINLALLSSLMYLNYHKGKDQVRDAEIYSCYARIFSRFKEDMPVILMEAEDFGIHFWYYYCWGMANAMTSIPIEYGTRDDYRKSSLMMQQNGTVAAVTGDALDDASWGDAIYYGGILSVQLYKSLIRFFTENKFSLSIEDRRKIYTLVDVFLHHNEDSKSLNNIRCIARYYQLEPYSVFGKIERPYLAPQISYKRLLDNWGDNLKFSIEKDTDKQFGGYVVTVEDLHLYPKLHVFFTAKEMENCLIYSCIIETDNSYNIRFVRLYGMNLYPIKLDVSRTNLFYNIPCSVALYENYLALNQSLVLIVGTDYDLRQGLKWFD